MSCFSLVSVSFHRSLVACVSLLLVGGAAAQVGDYTGADPAALIQAKAVWATHAPEAMAPAMARLVREADKLLSVAPPAVTQKARSGPSGDLHDYVSTGPYWWPDPAQPDGLPYIRKDGQINPESRTIASDQLRIELLGDVVSTLALAYFFTGNEDYAEHAARCLRVWFLDPATRMNPNFDYGQGIPGLEEGRPAGLIEAGGAVAAADASSLLEGSVFWSEADETALRVWCSAFLDWMLTSDIGSRARAAVNNHGTIDDGRAVQLAIKTGRIELAREILETAKTERIAKQIEPDGRQPHELTRTKSFNYSRLNLQGLVNLAGWGERLGVDLWHYRTADGRSIRAALDFLMPYLEDPSKVWPYQQIVEVDRVAMMRRILEQANRVYSRERYGKLLQGQPPDPTARRHLFNQPPVSDGPKPTAW